MSEALRRANRNMRDLPAPVMTGRHLATSLAQPRFEKVGMKR
jgi:hypothetical protein